MKNSYNYPDNWRDTIRPAILKRDNYRCVKCNIKHRQCVLVAPDGSYIFIDKNEVKEYRANKKRAFQIFLQVSHLNHIKHDCRHENLQTLCPKCHFANDKEFNKLAKLNNKK